MSTIRTPTRDSPAVPAPPQRSAEDEDLAPLGRSLTTAEKRHFLSRTSFGSTELAVAEITALGLERYVDRMLDVNAFQGVATIESQALSSLIQDPNYPFEQSGVWVSIMLYTPNPFQEVMALFWNGHFGASFTALQAGNQYYAPGYMRLLRTKGTGSFKELVVQVSTSPLMLVFLNGADSTKAAPNENFARELWELFTLGRDNGYTQADIVQASRALTGYKLLLPQDNAHILLEYDITRHDSGDKQVFGRTLAGRTGENGAQEYRDLVELTFSARDPAPWIARKLWEHFVYLDPSEELVAKLAKELRAHDWDLTAFLRTVFLSKAFFSPAANVGIVKSPVEYVIGFLRATGLILPIYFVYQMLDKMGQCPGLPPGVNGWPSGKLWLSSANLVQRTNMVGAAVGLLPPRGLEHLLPPAEQRSKAEVVTALVNHLNLSIEPEERHLYEESLDTGHDAKGNPSTVPFNGNDPELVSERVGSLLYVLAQHPAYHLR